VLDVTSSAESVSNLRVPQRAGNSLTRWATNSFSRRTQLHKISYLVNGQYLTPCILVLLAGLPVTQPLRNFPLIYGTRRSITLFARAVHRSLLSQISPVYTTPASLSKIRLNNIRQPTFCSCSSSISYWLSYQKPTHILLLSLPSSQFVLQATATCRRNLVATFVDRGVSRGQRGGSLTVVNLSFLDRGAININTKSRNLEESVAS
jgi:hypothetical protein